MRRAIAKPEKNNGEKLTIPARTRSPLEAFKMFEAGQNIDLVAGYYEQEGYLEPDFYMMDKIGKLKELNKYREMRKEKEGIIQKAVEEHNGKIQEEKKQMELDAMERRIQEEVQKRLSNNSNTINNEK